MLLDAIDSYLIQKNIKQKEFIHEKLIHEYNLVKALQIAYFKEYKKYITITEISNEANGSEADSNTSFKRHFNQKRGVFKFRNFAIFQIEFWAHNNLDVYLDGVQNLISKWRERNHDNSLYARQDTPFKSIAYDMLVLYAHVNDIVIHLARLDEVLKERFPEYFPKQFFNRRINQNRDKKGIITSTDLLYGDLLVEFVKENFYLYVQKDSKLLIDKIYEYLGKPSTRLSHSYFFTQLKPFQLKLLIDITKGLDVSYCDYFDDEELITKDSLGGVCRGHIDEDADYNYTQERFLDGNVYKYRFKLVPLRFLTSHHETHSQQFPTELINSLIEARIRHLFKLCEMPYNHNFSLKYYNNKFRQIFEEKEDFIFYFGKNVNIWNEFYDDITGKTVSGLSNTIIYEFVRRWIDFNKMSEQDWYTKYYEEFYAQKYLVFLQRVKEYKQNRCESEAKPFYEWFLDEYLNNERFP